MNQEYRTQKDFTRFVNLTLGQLSKNGEYFPNNHPFLSNFFLRNPIATKQKPEQFRVWVKNTQKYIAYKYKSLWYPLRKLECIRQYQTKYPSIFEFFKIYSKGNNCALCKKCNLSAKHDLTHFVHIKDFFTKYDSYFDYTVPPTNFIKYYNDTWVEKNPIDYIILMENWIFFLRNN